MQIFRKYFKHFVLNECLTITYLLKALDTIFFFIFISVSYGRSIMKLILQRLTVTTISQQYAQIFLIKWQNYFKCQRMYNKAHILQLSINRNLRKNIKQFLLQTQYKLSTYSNNSVGYLCILELTAVKVIDSC